MLPVLLKSAGTFIGGSSVIFTAGEDAFESPASVEPLELSRSEQPASSPQTQIVNIHRMRNMRTILTRKARMHEGVKRYGPRFEPGSGFRCVVAQFLRIVLRNFLFA